MKKIILGVCFWAISTLSFATANFTSSSGVFLIPNVSVDGTTNYKSVTLQLDLANGTFTVLDATAKNNAFSETAIATETLNGLKVNFFGCIRSERNQMTCKVTAVSTDGDKSLKAWGGGSTTGETVVFDNLGRGYKAKVSMFDKVKSLWSDVNLVQGVPAAVEFIFDDIDIEAESFTGFIPMFRFNGENTTAVFRDIPL